MLGVKFVYLCCSFCGRHFRVSSGDIEKIAAEGIACKFCGKHLEVIILDDR